MPRVKYISRGMASLSRSLNGAAMNEFHSDQGQLYLRHMRRRFAKHSAGGGDWPRLAASTVRRKGHSRMLVDKRGTIKKALNKGAPGNLFRANKRESIVGFGGSGNHPKAGVSIAKLATWHNDGAGRNPRRQILAKPDSDLLREMRNLAKKHGRKWLQNAARAQLGG